jgi:hypothetical protein
MAVAIPPDLYESAASILAQAGRVERTCQRFTSEAQLLNALRDLATIKHEARRHIRGLIAEARVEARRLALAGGPSMEIAA